MERRKKREKFTPTLTKTFEQELVYLQKESS